MTIEEYKELMKKDVLKIGLDVENNSEEAGAWCDEIIDLLGNLGWDYQCMTTSGRETYDEIMQMLGVIEPDEVYMELY